MTSIFRPAQIVICQTAAALTFSIVGVVGRHLRGRRVLLAGVGVQPQPGPVLPQGEVDKVGPEGGVLGVPGGPAAGALAPAADRGRVMVAVKAGVAGLGGGQGGDGGGAGADGPSLEPAYKPHILEFGNIFSQKILENS